MVRTQIQLTERQSSALKERAAREGVSVAKLVRQAIEDTILSEKPTHDEETIRRALAAVGYLKGGPGDLSENHDKYLAEAYLR